MTQIPEGTRRRHVLYTVVAPGGNLSAWYAPDSDVDWLAIELGHRAADALRKEQA